MNLIFVLVTLSATILTIFADENSERFQLAVQNGSIEAVATILQSVSRSEKSRLVNYENPATGYSTPLLDAAKSGDLEMVKFLIGQGALVKPTVFHNAAYFGHVDIVRYLLQTDGNLLETKNGYGNTALNLAAANGKLDVVKFLVSEKRASIENGHETGNTPLTQAADGGHVDVFNFLLQNGANIYVRDGETRETGAHLSAYFGQIDVLKTYIETDPNFVRAKDSHHNMPLNMAVLNGQTETVKFLLQQDSSTVNNPGEMGRTAIAVAAKEGYADIVQLLADNGADLYAKDDNGEMPIHLAAGYGNADIVGYFIQMDLGLLNAKDELGRTPLQFAKLQHQNNVVAYLESLESPKSRRY